MPVRQAEGQSCKEQGHHGCGAPPECGNRRGCGAYAKLPRADYFKQVELLILNPDCNGVVPGRELTHENATRE